MKRLSLMLVFVACAAAAADSPASESSQSLENLHGVVQQTRFRISHNAINAERFEWNSKTGETQHIRFQSIPIAGHIPDLDLHALPIKIRGGFLRMKDADAYWDSPQQRWRKIPKGFSGDCVGPSFDKNSVIFGSNTFVSSLVDCINDSPRENDKNDPYASVRGVRTYKLGGENPHPSADRDLEVFVDDKGMIVWANIYHQGTLITKITNELSEKFSFAPEIVDTAIYDRFRHLSVENDGLTGLSFKSEAGQLLISAVLPASPASAAGATVGEQILFVNGGALQSGTVEEFWSLAKGRATVSVQTVSSDGDTKHYEIRKQLSLRGPVKEH